MIDGLHFFVGMSESCFKEAGGQGSRKCKYILCIKNCPTERVCCSFTKMRRNGGNLICWQHLIQNISNSCFHDNIFIEFEIMDNMANSKDEVDKFFDLLEKFKYFVKP